jgi:hypothetical protein
LICPTPANGSKPKFDLDREQRVAVENLAWLRAKVSAIPRQSLCERMRAADMLARIDRLLEAHLAALTPDSLPK